MGPFEESELFIGEQHAPGAREGYGNLCEKTTVKAKLRDEDGAAIGQAAAISEDFLASDQAWRYSG